MDKTVVRRTFAALEQPRGSAERNRLNADPVTSEYLPGTRWLVLWPALMSDGRPNPAQEFHSKEFRTKREAEAYAKGGA